MFLILGPTLWGRVMHTRDAYKASHFYSGSISFLFRYLHRLARSLVYLPDTFQGPYLVHLKAIGVNMLTEEEQATSRENCQVWKERKEKVKLFEGKQTAAAKKRSGVGDKNKVQKNKEVSFKKS